MSTGNACRSQIAEGWARTLAPGHVVVRSAGTRPRHLHPLVAWVMQEAGVDISGQSSKLVSTLSHVPFDLVITVCGHADEHCPAFLTNANVVHVGFDDPPQLAKTASDPEAALDHYRRVRDEIRDFVANRLPQMLPA